MADKVVSVTLKAKVDGFTAGMQKAKASVDDLTKAAAPASKGDAFKKLSDSAALAGVGIAAGLGVAVNRFAEFDAAMSAVKANSGATGASLDALREAAVKMGADSQFSAKEAADGINELAKAGVKTGDILGGGLKGSLDLAAAGQIGVAEAAETAASAMTQFNLSGDKVPHIADLLTNAANKAQGGVGDMGAALKQAGLVAAATGLTIEETTAGLTAFASAGLIGSDAGTSFKTMLQRLSAPSGEAAELMKELGINAYDANGQFVGLETVAGQLKAGMEDLTPAQRNAAMATIFGADAVRAANVLYSEGAEGIAKWTAEVSEQGAAAKQAATLTDNLKGDVERLGGAFDSVLIQTGSGANSGLRSLVQGFTGLVETVGRVPGPVLLAGGALASLAAFAPKGILKFREYQANLDKLGLSMEKISAKSPKAANALSTVGKAAGGIAGALTALSVANAAFADGLEELGTEQLVAGWTSAGGSLDAINKKFAETSRVSTALGEAATGINSVGDAIKYAFNPGASANVEQFFGSIGSAFTIENSSQIQVAKTRLSELDAALTALVSSGRADVAAQQFATITREAAAQGVSVEQLKAKFPQYAEALAGVSNAASGAAAAGVQLTNVEKGAAAAAQMAADDTKAWSDALNGLNSPMLSAREAARQLEEAIDNASGSIKENGRSLDINTEKGRANQAALDGVAKAAIDQIGALQANGASQGELQKALNTSRDRLIATYLQFDNNTTRANAYADSVLKIPASKSTNFSTPGLPGAISKARELYSTINRITGKTVYVNVVTRQLGQSGASIRGGQVKGAATGGAIVGPGTGTSDSIPAMLSNGEHVLTAAEVRMLGGQSAAYALRSAIRQGSLPKFAKGGAVSAVQKFAKGGAVSSKSFNFDVVDALLGSTAKRQDSTEIAAITAGFDKVTVVLGDIGKARASLAQRINASADKVRAANAKLAAAQATGNAELIKVAAANLASAKRSAAAVAAELRTVEASSRTATVLTAQASRSEAFLKGLAVKRSELVTQIEETTRKIQELEQQSAQYAEQVASAAGARGALQQLFYGGEDGAAVSIAEVVQGIRSVASETKAFGSLVQQLKAQGLSQSLLDQVIGAGVEKGSEMARAILAGGPEIVKALNAAEKQLAAASATLGKKAADAMYGAGIQAAKGLVAGLKSQQKAIEAQMVTIAKAMESAIRRALKIKSPSRVMQTVGGFTAEGLAVGMMDKASLVEASALSLARAAVPSPGLAGVSRFASASQRPRADVSRVSLAGLSIVGTLDTPFGPAQVRGVVQDELSSTARSARLQGVSS